MAYLKVFYKKDDASANVDCDELRIRHPKSHDETIQVFTKTFFEEGLKIMSKTEYLCEIADLLDCRPFNDKC